MPITQQELGRRIRAAREACRLTQDEVAARLGVARPTIVQIEAGNRTVSSLELDRLAYLLGQDIRDFLADSFRGEHSLAALFRAQSEDIRKPEVLDALRDCIALGREITELERLVGVESGPASTAVYSLPEPATRWDAIQQGERLARDERRRLGLGSAPLPDVSELLETQGVRTGVLGLPSDVSGLTISDPNTGLFVVANRAHGIHRRRFSFAHEFGHVLVDRGQFGIVSRESKRDDLLEVRANAFAACFLMPEEGVRQFVANLGKGKPSRAYAQVFDEAESLSVEGRAEPGSQDLQLYDVVRLAHHFGVSRIAALYRLLNLGLLKEPDFKRLEELDEQGKGEHLARRLGLQTPKALESRDGLERRFLALALEAYRREEISKSKFKELTALAGLRSDQTRQLLTDAGLDNDEPPSKRRS
jgi:Zn-dependent peptidase ImmA (M78 family)/DNA-binding XRE family transcriptional regulator